MLKAKIFNSIFGKKEEEEFELNYETKEKVLSEIEKAKKELYFAQMQFDNAEDMFIDVAAKELEFAKTRLDALLKYYKKTYES